MNYYDLTTVIGAEVCACICGGIMLALVYGLEISAITIGAVFDDTYCYNDIIPLSEWLLIGGIVGAVGMTLNMLTRFVPHKILSVTIISVPLTIFNAIWFALGLAIVTRLSPSCKEESRVLWDMSIAYIVFCAIRTICIPLAVYSQYRMQNHEDGE